MINYQTLADEKEKNAREEACENLYRVIKMSEQGEIGFADFYGEMKLIMTLLDMRNNELKDITRIIMEESNAKNNPIKSN